MARKSFFERLTGTINLRNNSPDRQPDRRRRPEPNFTHDDNFDNRQVAPYEYNQQNQAGWGNQPNQVEDEPGELAIDLYETPEEIVIQAMVAGVHPDDLDVTIARDYCEVSGRRDAPQGVSANYYAEELYWGTFARVIELPATIEVDEAQADEAHGLLTITLPKEQSSRETKLQVRSLE